MRQGWESEAGNWLYFARTPGADRAHENINMPALLDLLPPPGRRTLDLACGEGRVSRLLQALHHRVVGVDAAPTMVLEAAAM
jgi:ubiquinone/menaquinone biosynthesis C-methylase UbiE